MATKDMGPPETHMTKIINRELRKFMSRKREVEHPVTDEQAMQLAMRERKAGKSPSTQARHFVHEEIEHAKKGRHTVRGARQAVAIGLSKARKHGIPVKPKVRRAKAA